MCTFVYVPPIRAAMCDAWMDPDVVFTVSKIVFCVMFMLGIKFIWVGLLTCGTIRFLHCRFLQRIVDYSVLNSGCS